MSVRAREFLWDLHGRDDGPPPLDAELSAYRAGSLDAREVERVEWMLTRSVAGRSRLVELAGISLPPAPERLRRRIFDGAPRGWSLRGPEWRWAAALVAVAALSFALLLPRFGDRGPAVLPEFTVRVEALAETRGAGGTLRARPDGTVRIVIEAEGKTMPGLEYGVYRTEGPELVRLSTGEVAIETHRGGAVIETTGARLASSSPGEHSFFVTVSRDATPPDRLSVVGDPAEALMRAGAGRVVRRTIEIEP